MFNQKTFKYITFVISLCCYVLLSACSTTSFFWRETNTEQLIEHHHYQKAIDKIKASTPVDTALLRKVNKLSQQYQHRQTEKINHLIKQKKWGEARFILEKLADSQPKTPILAILKASINTAQVEEERLINTRRALLEYELLDLKFAQLNLTNRINFNKYIWFPQDSILMKKKQTLAENLLQLSTQALLVKDYKNAQRTYEKAIELNRELQTGEITKAINTGLSLQNNKAIEERERSLIKQLYSAIATHDFDSILSIQEILSHDPFQGDNVEKALQAAKHTRTEYAKKLDNTASQQYRNGNISLAVIQWQQALLLAPNDIRIQERLIRAKKVKKKLEKLKSNEENATVNDLN